MQGENYKTFDDKNRDKIFVFLKFHFKIVQYV